MIQHTSPIRQYLLTISVLALLYSFSYAAVPYRPTDDAEVLETLPIALFSGLDELTTLRRKLALDPTDAELATNVASRYVRLGKRGGEPRFYGYARAALQPWWTENDAPVEILAIRAKLKERDHEYQSALADLELLVKKAPNNIQAWIEITNINRVQGNYEAAWKASERIVEIADKTTALIAQAPIMTATGRSAEAYTALEKLAPIAEEHWPEAIDWVLTMRAEVARALGHEDEAEQHFQAGLERSPEDQYLLRSYADLLIEQHREEEVVTLLNDHINDTGILLRATIAAQRVGKDEEASAWQSQLEQRFEEIRLRGDRPHGRYESRYWLELKGNPEKAFTVGMENWHKQKEPRDTQNVLEAAVAANLSIETVQPVIDFIEAHKVDHTVLLELVTELKGSR